MNTNLIKQEINNLAYLTTYKVQEKINNDFFLEYTEPRLKKEAEILFNNGWWFLPSLPTDFFYVELDGITEINEKLLTEKITEYHNKDDFENLEKIVENWSLPYFSDNKQIFEDALWAHKQGKYTLTTPVLTIQVEAAIRNYLQLEKFRFKNYVEELKKRCKDSCPEKEGFNSFMQAQDLNFINKNLEKFYKSFDPTTKEFDEVYRNPLLHGQDQSYASIESSTKLFLFLDMIHEIIRDIETAE